MIYLPTEILLMIYEFSTIQTRLTLNTAFKWSYRFANPLMGKQVIPLYPIHSKMFQHKLNYEIEQYNRRIR
jgi:hypothetical protein